MIKPLRSQILIKALPTESVLPSGIHLAARYTPEQQLFKVLAVGPGRRVYRKKLKEWHVVAPDVSVGDTVLMDQYSINSKFDCGDGTWLIDADHVSLAVTNEVKQESPR